MGDLEGRSRRLARRARRLEVEAAFYRQAQQRAEERLLRTALSNVSTEELVAMHEHLEGKEEEEGWTEEDRPLMLRLLELKEEARREQEAGDFPWRAAIRKPDEEAGP